MCQYFGVIGVAVSEKTILLHQMCVCVSIFLHSSMEQQSSEEAGKKPTTFSYHECMRKCNTLRVVFPLFTCAAFLPLLALHLPLLLRPRVTLCRAFFFFRVFKSGLIIQCIVLTSLSRHSRLLCQYGLLQ